MTETPSGRARLRQLLRKMPPGSRLVALGRIDEQLYGQCFEAEFGRLPQHRADADRVEDVSSDDAACAAELEKNVGVGHADLEDAHPPADGSAFQETQARSMNTDEIRGECGKGDEAAEVELPDNSGPGHPDYTSRLGPHSPWEGEEAAATYAAAARSPSITRAQRQQPAVAGTEWPNLLARRRPVLRLLDPAPRRPEIR